MNISEETYRVIAMGKTGSGKSTVLNSLTRTKHFQVSESMESQRKKVQSLKCRFKGRFTSPNITFIDTPGFFDRSTRDSYTINEIALSLREIEDGLNLVLFCFPAYEIRLAASMQACWKFLKLVMGNAVYEHVVIVLTHGSGLTSEELENAVARMTTEFIPYLRNTLNCKVKEEILIFNKDESDDGLDGVLGYITSNKKYRPALMEDLGKFWNPEDPVRSIEYLIQNSKVFNKIQEILLEVQNKNICMSDPIGQTKKKIGSIVLKKDEFQKFQQNIKEQFKRSQKSVHYLRNEMIERIEQLKGNMEKKDKQIETLSKELAEIKNLPILQGALPPKHPHKLRERKITKRPLKNPKDQNISIEDPKIQLMPVAEYYNKALKNNSRSKERKHNKDYLRRALSPNVIINYSIQDKKSLKDTKAHHNKKHSHQGPFADKSVERKRLHIDHQYEKPYYMRDIRES